MGNGAHVYLSGNSASSWRNAGQYVLINVCGVKTPNDDQLEQAEETLAAQNIVHLKSEGAYGESKLSNPALADHRAFSVLVQWATSQVEIYVEPADFCPEPVPVEIETTREVPAEKACPETKECDICPPPKECSILWPLPEIVEVEKKCDPCLPQIECPKEPVKKPDDGGKKAQEKVKKPENEKKEFVAP